MSKTDDTIAKNYTEVKCDKCGRIHKVPLVIGYVGKYYCICGNEYIKQYEVTC